MSVDVYLIAQLQFMVGFGSHAVIPKPKFKIGYSRNPFQRVDQLKSTTPYNLALYAVIICDDERAAAEVEKECHDRLAQYRKRGEWFYCDATAAWEVIAKGHDPDRCLWLTKWYYIDLDAMRLVAPSPTAWGGVAANWHRYKAWKDQGAITDAPMGR